MCNFINNPQLSHQLSPLFIIYYVTIINDYENMTRYVTRIRPDDRSMIASPTIRGLLKILSIG